VPAESARTTGLAFGITAIDTDYVRPMLDASHLIVHGGRAAFVDTGTNASVPGLIDALGKSGIDRGDVDYVFLTHVHLDHAGGAGSLMQRLPNARAVLHPRGARHVIDPTRLIEGSIAVYGAEAFRRLYGELVPIDESRVVIAADEQVFELGDRPLRVFHTEGHARHHYCLHDPYSSGVFTGDSFGISYREFDTARGEFIYPTTTPVHFDPAEAHKAIERILSCAPERLYLTHYSQVTDVGRLANDLHRRIDDFVAIAEAHAGSEERTARMHEAMYAYLIDALREHGCSHRAEALRALLRMDVELNVMGLEFWLDHR
jgi:glyoxylase-like metal-dependent hydrolase (beta-lactamase superfamily II)